MVHQLFSHDLKSCDSLQNLRRLLWTELARPAFPVRLSPFSLQIHPGDEFFIIIEIRYLLNILESPHVLFTAGRWRVASVPRRLKSFVPVQKTSRPRTRALRTAPLSIALHFPLPSPSSLPSGPTPRPSCAAPSSPMSPRPVPAWRLTALLLLAIFAQTTIASLIDDIGAPVAAFWDSTVTPPSPAPPRLALCPSEFAFSLHIISFLQPYDLPGFSSFPVALPLFPFTPPSPPSIAPF